MPPNKGKLWETALRDRTPVWLLEWEVRRRLPRRVLLAADTSDSCAHERDRLKALFRTLADSLEVGDGCALWVMGRRDKALEASLGRSQDRPELAQKFERALAPVRGATWLRETLGAMLAEAERTDPTSTSVFLLLATDGEIFDAEGLAQRAKWPLGLVRLGERASRQLEVLARMSVPVAASAPALKGFLVNPPSDVALDPGLRRAARLVAFSEQGDVLGELPQDGLVAVENGHRAVRVAYVGGERPQPRLRYRSGERVWNVAEVECAELPAEPPEHLRRLVRGLEGNEVAWDHERLALLAADREKKEELTCPKCGRKRLARRSLFCYCHALLVSVDGVGQREALELYPGTICFPLDGGTVHGPPVACERDTGSDAYDVQEDQGRDWLVLNLYK